MSDLADLLEGARAAFGRRDWVAARQQFRAARDREALSADNLYALANSAWWLGALDEALPAQQKAYRLYLDEDRPRQAALVSLDTGYTLPLRGEPRKRPGG